MRQASLLAMVTEEYEVAAPSFFKASHRYGSNVAAPLSPVRGWKGVRTLCEAPFGPFRQRFLPLFQPTIAVSRNQNIINYVQKKRYIRSDPDWCLPVRSARGEPATGVQAELRVAVPPGPRRWGPGGAMGRPGTRGSGPGRRVTT